MFESILNEYLQRTACRNWTIIAMLVYIKSKSDNLSVDMFENMKADIYSVLRDFSDRHIHLQKNAKERAKKLLSNFNNACTSTKVRLFIEGLPILKEHLTTRILIEDDIHNAETSLPENVRNESGEPSKVATEYDSEKRHGIPANVREEMSDEVENISETIQTSKHSSDLNDVAEIDSIIVKKISYLLLESEYTLEEIWKKVMERLKEEDLRVQSIESRIIDLSSWTKIEWKRILKSTDYSQLFNRSRKKLHKDKIDEDVHELLRSDPGQIRSLNDLEQWKAKFSDLKSIDANLAFKIMEFFNQCLRREINILVMQNRKRDFIVKILNPIIGTLLEEFDIGTFELNWIEEESHSVTNRKRKDVHEEYTTLTSEIRKMDLIISSRSYKTGLLPLEVVNTVDDTKYGKDHSKLKVVMKDCLDSLRGKLHFKKVELEAVFALGIQITGTRWNIYSLSYDNSQDFYFFVEMATLILPTTFSDMEDLLPDFLENLLALRYTLIDLVKKIRSIAQKRLNTPSPPSSPLHSTTESPPSMKKQKQDPFGILDNLRL